MRAAQAELGKRVSRSSHSPVITSNTEPAFATAFDYTRQVMETVRWGRFKV